MSNINLDNRRKSQDKKIEIPKYSVKTKDNNLLIEKLKQENIKLASDNKALEAHYYNLKEKYKNLQEENKKNLSMFNDIVTQFTESHLQILKINSDNTNIEVLIHNNSE